jgi:hypothetical protein
MAKPMVMIVDMEGVCAEEVKVRVCRMVCYATPIAAYFVAHNAKSVRT